MVNTTTLSVNLSMCLFYMKLWLFCNITLSWWYHKINVSCSFIFHCSIYFIIWQLSAYVNCILSYHMILLPLWWINVIISARRLCNRSTWAGHVLISLVKRSFGLGRSVNGLGLGLQWAVTLIINISSYSLWRAPQAGNKVHCHRPLQCAYILLLTDICGEMQHITALCISASEYDQLLLSHIDHSSSRKVMSIFTF